MLTTQRVDDRETHRLRAGSHPPSRPMIAAKAKASTRIVGVTRKLKAIEEKVAKLPNVVEKPLIGIARITPTTPPASASINDSAGTKASRSRSETQRAQRTDFDGARGDRRVHRVHRAKYRANRHDAETTSSALAMARDPRLIDVVVLSVWASRLILGSSAIRRVKAATSAPASF